MPPPALVKDYATDMGLRPASVEPGEKFLDASGKSFISEYLLSENDEASKKEFVEKGANFWLVYYSKPFIEKTGANNYNSGFGWVGDEASAVHFRNERKCRVDSYKIPKNEIGNVKKKFDENRHWAGLDTKAPGGSLSRNRESNGLQATSYTS